MSFNAKQYIDAYYPSIIDAPKGEELRFMLQKMLEDVERDTRLAQPPACERCAECDELIAAHMIRISNLKEEHAEAMASITKEKERWSAKATIMSDEVDRLREQMQKPRVCDQNEINELKAALERTKLRKAGDSVLINSLRRERDDYHKKACEVADERDAAKAKLDKAMEVCTAVATETGSIMLPLEAQSDDTPHTISARVVKLARTIAA